MIRFNNYITSILISARFHTKPYEFERCNGILVSFNGRNHLYSMIAAIRSYLYINQHITKLYGTDSQNHIILFFKVF